MAEVLVAPLGRNEGIKDHKQLISPIRQFCLRAIALHETA
ncbi:hypothetical protein MNBD_ALPHA03-1020 [hydrothermal vent metagenome]|uniref:Uncharacterized protein n=1 Tax=hydrothermal vent metagenome TaxID=652676 RepID=A0A3B1AY63_9ZZZZ